MGIKPKNIIKKKQFLALAVILLLLIAGAGGFLFQDKIKTLTESLAADSKNNDKPRFIVDETLTDWLNSGNTWHEGGDHGGDTTTALSLQQCPIGSNCNQFADACRESQDCDELEGLVSNQPCMVHFYHISKAINPDEALADYLKQSSDFGIGFSEIAVKTLSIKTPEGDKSYQLHQFESDNKSGQYKQGTSVGYVPLSDAHIKIQGICDLPSQLDEALPALTAVHFGT